MFAHSRVFHAIQSDLEGAGAIKTPCSVLQRVRGLTNNGYQKGSLDSFSFIGYTVNNRVQLFKNLPELGQGSQD